MTAWLERWQVSLYLVALGGGALSGWLLPSSAPHAEAAINPVLMVLLYATFLAVPLTKLRAAVRDVRFMLAVLVVNFVLAPTVVWALTRIIHIDQALLIGVLLVLLAPCIDYVIVFTRLAGGDYGKLLSVTPVLMLAQMALLPGYIVLFAGREVAAHIEWVPFAQAFVFLIMLPLGLAMVTQRAAINNNAAKKLMGVMESAMVPMMILTLFVVVASQFGKVLPQLSLLGAPIAVYVLFLLVMPPLGYYVGRFFRHSVSGCRAVSFTGVTRNSLVVLPLALTLPPAGIVVVTQTLVELVGMVVLVQVYRFCRPGLCI